MKKACSFIGLITLFFGFAGGFPLLNAAYAQSYNCNVAAESLYGGSYFVIRVTKTPSAYITTYSATCGTPSAGANDNPACWVGLGGTATCSGHLGVREGFVGNCRITVGVGQSPASELVRCYADVAASNPIPTVPPPAASNTPRPPQQTPTPVATAEPSGSPTTTPSPGQSLYLIPIGTKDKLSINIGEGGGNGPLLNFGIKLYGADKTPDIKIRLKAVDAVAALTPVPTGGQSGDGCQTPRGPSETFFKDIVMTADSNGIYHPKPGTTFTISHGDGNASGNVNSDGRIALIGLTTGHLYSFSVKGEKQRSQLMVDHYKLGDSQNLDWTALPLDAGDLPDPTNNYLQDCVVNVNDISIMKNLINNKVGSTNENDLRVGDLDYNGIINAADMSLLLHTLQTKPDDN